MNNPIILVLAFSIGCINGAMIGYVAGYWYHVTGRKKITPDMMPKQTPMDRPKVQRTLDEILNKVSPFAPKKDQPVVEQAKRPTKPKVTSWLKHDVKPEPKSETRRLPPVDWGNNK